MDEQLKKRLAGAAVVVLLAFALVSLLPQEQDRPASDTQVVTIPLSPELIGTPDAPPASETTPSSLQAPVAGNESTLNPAELAAASGGDDDAPPDSASAAPASTISPASGAVLAKTEPATALPEAASPAKPAVKPPENSPAKLAVKPAAAKPADKAAGKAVDAASSAPAKPVASTSKPVSAPGPADKISPLPAKPASAAAPVVVKQEPVKAAPASPAAPRGGNWFVQIGGYADIDNARQAQKQVRSHNQDCIIAPVDTNKGTLYRVRAGPYRDRETAQAAQVRLSAAGFASAALVAP